SVEIAQRHLAQTRALVVQASTARLVARLLELGETQGNELAGNRFAVGEGRTGFVQELRDVPVGVGMNRDARLRSRSGGSSRWPRGHRWGWMRTHRFGPEDLATHRGGR